MIVNKNLLNVIAAENPTETVESVLAEMLRPSNLRLHMGELTANEVRIAQAAVQFAYATLATAHARGVATSNDALTVAYMAGVERMRDRAEAAEGLLREAPTARIEESDDHFVLTASDGDSFVELGKLVGQRVRIVDAAMLESRNG